MHIEARLKQLDSKQIDWSTAEALCFAACLSEGHAVRLVGQDVGRGTFSQRHAILYDQATNTPFVPMSVLGPGSLEVIDSPLSELAVLGFEYGQSIVAHHGKLCIWEAQFGDFANGAQTVIDAFITSGEQKWGLQSGIVLLLPHGYNGAGPEHSSCRMERFLQLSDEVIGVDEEHGRGVNIQVAQPTTSANYFHLLRRQLKRNYRKPLVVASAKQLLRLPAAGSDLHEFISESTFRKLIYSDECAREGADCIIFTSGEIAYELMKHFPKALIVRFEQICPFPRRELKELLSMAGASRFAYLQPEPENMGAFKYIAERLEPLLEGRKLKYIGRKPCATPATGFPQQHKTEHEEIVRAAEAFLNKVV